MNSQVVQLGAVEEIILRKGANSMSKLSFTVIKSYKFNFFTISEKFWTYLSESTAPLHHNIFNFLILYFNIVVQLVVQVWCSRVQLWCRFKRLR